MAGARKMMNFLNENWGTILVLVIVIAAVGAVVWNMFQHKRIGESGCMDCPSRETSHPDQ